MANLVGAGIAGIAGVGVTWLVARGLGPTQAGAFFAATAAFVLAGGVAKLGAPTSLVYWPARLRAGGQPHLLGACLRIGLPPVAFAGLAIGAALWLGAPWLAAQTAGDASRHTAMAEQLRVLAAFLPLAVLTDAMLAASRGYRAMGPTVWLDRITRPALQVVGIGALAVLTLYAPVPLAAYPLAWVAPYLPVALLAAYQLRRVHRRTAPRAADGAPRFRRATRLRLRRAFWRFAGPRAVATVAQLGLQRVDVLLVAALGGLGAAALYAVAGRFVVLGQLANQGISLAVQPRLAEALATGDRAGARVLYQTATGWLVLITWPLYLMVMVFAPLYLALFGEAYRDGGQIVAVLAAAMLLATGCGMVDMVLAMGGRTAWNLANVGLALAVAVALDLLLIPRLGALGAAIGLAAALAVNNLLPLAQISLSLRVHPFGRGTITAAALGLTCFGAVPLAAASIVGVGPPALLISLAAGTAGYLAGAVALRRPLALDALAALRRRPTHEET
jgi:O-antigen/teichoic acid export membrane protein